MRSSGAWHAGEKRPKRPINLLSYQGLRFVESLPAFVASFCLAGCTLSTLQPTVVAYVSGKPVVAVYGHWRRRTGGDPQSTGSQKRHLKRATGFEAVQSRRDIT